MPNTLKATLPYPPTVNHYWRHARGRFYVSEEGRQYRRRVRGILAGVPTFTGPVALTIEVFPPDNRTRDLNNLSKALLDALEAAGVYEDDSQSKEEHWYMRAPDKPGRVEVTVTDFGREP